MIKFEKIPPSILSSFSEMQKVLAEDANVIFAYLFGGLAKGPVKPLSDIDIAVYVKDIRNLAEYKFELFDKLTDILDTAEQDIVILNTASISITGRILQNKQILVDKNPLLRHTYESLTLREFFDFRIMEEAILYRRYGLG
ncbi:MAG: nucleotidyltransferase domain-containing protein [Spirochaetota bacterium]